MATTASQSPVNTGRVSGRRKLHFVCCDDALAECERLLNGGYRRLGNWSLGKMADHLAAAYQIGLEPVSFRVPWVMRFVARNVFKKSALKQMRPGFKLPRGAAAVLEPNEVEDRAGVEHLRETLARWKQTPSKLNHPFFGKLTDEEWEQLMLRHCEMHLGFLLPGEA